MRKLKLNPFETETLGFDVDLKPGDFQVLSVLHLKFTVLDLFRFKMFLQFRHFSDKNLWGAWPDE